MLPVARVTRPLRVLGRRLGLVRRRSAAAARAVARCLDDDVPGWLAASGAPGLLVAVRLPGEPDLVRAYGVAGEGRPMTPGTRVQALSLTKPVTAMVALRLVEDGVLTLDDPVWRYTAWRMPAHRTHGHDVEGVTLRRLLAHDAGLNVHGFGWVDPRSAPPVVAWLEREAEPEATLALVAPPGSGLRYSGGGYALVEHAVEATTRRAFAQVAREVLLAPLGIEGGYERTLLTSPETATRHDAQGLALPAMGLASVAASGLNASVGALATLFLAAGDPAGPLQAPSRRALLSPQSRDARGAACGLGFYVRGRRGECRYMHLGYDPGWNLHAFGYLRRRAVAVIASNGDRGREVVPQVARALSRCVRDGVA